MIGIINAYAADGSTLGTITDTVEYGSDVERHTMQSIDLDAAHPVSDLLGVRTFQRLRRPQVDTFRGADLNLTARHLGDDCIVGHGFMPQAGFNVQMVEWSVDGTKYRYQELRRSAELIAVLVGTESEREQPLNGPKWAGMTSLRWEGTLVRYTPSGELQEQGALVRRYDGLQYQDEFNGRRQLTVELELWAPYYIVSGSVLGIAKLYEWALVYEAAEGAQRYLKAVEVFDAVTGIVVGLHQWLVDGVPSHSDVFRLRRV